MNHPSPIQNSIQNNTLTPYNPPSRSTRTLTAKRLVNTKTLNYAEWLEVRKQGIGSSDCAAACGLNPYMSMLELWMLKTGRIQPNFEDESEGHAPMYWGKRLEPLVAEYYSLHTNTKVRRVNAVLQHPDPDKYFMLANLDYAVVGSDEVQILECKTAGEYGSKLWRDGVPLYVLCQVQHQLAVTGKQAAHLCVLLCGHETRIFKVTRSESVIQHIVNAERYFWDCVEKDIPPEADACESSAKALQLLYPEHVPLSTTDLSEDEQANQQFEQLLQARNQIEKHQEQFDLLKHQLQAKMQDTERATFKTGSVTWKKSKDSISLDAKALLLQHPEYLNQFPQTKQGSRRFQIYSDAT